MRRQPITSMLLAMIVGMVLFVLGAQRAYAAMPLNVTSSGDIVEAAPTGKDCNDSCNATYALTVNIVGSGSVGKQPDQSTYLHGTLVNLTASAGDVPFVSAPIGETKGKEGFIFSGWSGASAGTGVCSVTMDSAKSVTATFGLISGAPNDAPSFTSAPVLSATAGANYTYFVMANDPDTGDFITLSAPLKPTWLALTPAGNGNAIVTGIPSADNIGAHLMRLRVQDASGAFATQAFVLIVVAPEPATTGSIQGTVVDRDGNGIGGAMVTLLAGNGDVARAAVYSQFTDSTGSYLFTDVQPGNYTITARIDDQASAALIAVTVLPGRPATVSSITLQPSQTFLHLPMLGR